MSWVWLVIAGALEIVWALGLKYTEGWTRLWPSLATVVAMAASFWCLAQAVKQIPIGTGYAIWTGIGAVGMAVLGMAVFAESAAWPRLACIGMIVAGIVGLKVTASS